MNPTENIPAIHTFLPPAPGTRMYGFGAIALGVTGLVLRDFATVWHPVPAGFPGRTGLALLAAVILVGTGSALQWRRFVLPAAAALAIYGDAALSPRTVRVCRLLYGVCAVSFGLNHFFAVPETAATVSAWLSPGQKFRAISTGTFHLLAGLAMFSEVRSVLAARQLTAMILTFGVLVGPPRLVTAPAARNAWGGNAINMAVAGAAWAVADSFASRASEGTQ